jgi:phenylpropionate dioxygenase-like ring-hydroxylating dioxygenase large terminal subunit
LIRNVGYDAAHARALSAGGVLGRIVAGERIALWRSHGDCPHALEDRCPHRHAGARK